MVSEVRIRPAERGDTRFLAWVMQEAGRSHLPRGIFEFAIADDAKRIDFLDAVANAEAPSFYQYSGFLVAEVDGRQAAALTGYEPAKAGPFMATASAAGLDAVGLSDQEQAQFGHAFEALMRCAPETHDDRWVIEFVATVPDLRGRGIVSKLIEEMLERGRERGYTKAQIGYLLGNDPARRVYERAGFKTVSEGRDAEFEAALGCPGLAGMHRDL